MARLVGLKEDDVGGVAAAGQVAGARADQVERLGVQLGNRIKAVGG